MNESLKSKIDQVLGEAAKHRYSVSRIYAAYNEAFEKNDPPQSCVSCLRSRVKELRKWHAEQTATTEAATTEAATTEAATTEAATTDVSIVELETADGEIFQFNSKDGEKGNVSHMDGKTVKPGKYVLTNGDELTVSVGSKAKLKHNEDLT